MHHAPPFLASLVIGLAVAFLFGLAARLLRMPPLVGYLVAGVVVGPNTPGVSIDGAFTSTMAEVGVGLLLFGVGLHFRSRDLLAVWRVAVPGATAQVAISTLLGAALAMALPGLGLGPALVFGLTLAIASTAVATRALEERVRLSGEAGRIALGWLVLQDLLVVLGLVLVPAASGGHDGIAGAALLAVAKLASFAALMLVVGRRTLPWGLERVARSGSRELFTLAVVAVALGVAFGASTFFGVSFALGAFFAGVVLGESDLGHQAAAETLPLQRIFAAIFFVSVGMLLDPRSVLDAPLVSLLALAVVLLGTGGGTLLLLVALRVPPATAATVAAALAQIGEFSFVLMELAIGQGILPSALRGPILLGSFGAILLMPLTFRAFAALAARMPDRSRPAHESEERLRAVPHRPEGHAIVVGYGRVGVLVTAALRRHDLPVIVVEDDRQRAGMLRAQGVPVLWGNATQPEMLEAAGVVRARLLIVTLPLAWEARRVVELAQAANPGLAVTVRAHQDAEVDWLRHQDSTGLAVMGEREVALGIADFALQRMGVAAGLAQSTVDALRRRRVADAAAAGLGA
ncbi:cation:proton antiporter domain-containing protein [Muricoccus pecuniae]|uniref:CPA2 family monovalent cation:H+ antiporter-2 n=1 Tax=Muricoccus pecuniae TaxID=693023 RepID=A0A840YEU1_9PROT|nr:cation:proton antiporter [Roseomonas pecuniae]MBB5692393.1 CPA2 family monovalent cation:H+ antiporter-2 [Roseomonas pecuniae]